MLLVTALLVGASALARVPRSALPRPPRWLWVGLVVAAVLSALRGGQPVLQAGGLAVGFGGLVSFARFAAVSVLVLWAAALVGWTTPIADVAPALARLLRPLRLVRVPVDELAVVVALCVRCLPLLVDEVRVLVAARRLRPRLGSGDEAVLRRWSQEGIDLLVAGLAVAIRRAGALAEAMSARGGTGQIAAPVPGPGRLDALCCTVVACVCVAAVLLAVA
ncbi:MAG: energy-coupling factor transporter transmembrane component T [Actinomycetota bacterium]|nr:energy-coupling factor transporter transmembrane component T [Actinomycetota bacterium]